MSRCSPGPSRSANGLTVDDKFDLVLQRDPADGSLGQLLYAGMDRVARADVELMKWTDGKHIIWINADGVGGDGASAMRMPVQGRLTSGFGERFHPILGYERFHAGVDLGRCGGHADRRRRRRQGSERGLGRRLRPGGRDRPRRCHRDEIRTHEPDRGIFWRVVHRGDVIGYVGSTAYRPVRTSISK